MIPRENHLVNFLYISRNTARLTSFCFHSGLLALPTVKDGGFTDMKFTTDDAIWLDFSSDNLIAIVDVYSQENVRIHSSYFRIAHSHLHF